MTSIATTTTWRSHCRPLLPPIVIHRRHRRRCRCCQATTTTTVTTVVKLTIIPCQRKRQRQHHHQRTNGSTNLKTFTSPVDLDLFNLSTVFEVSDVGQGNLAISKLLALKKICTIFAIYILLDELLYILGRWWGGGGTLHGGRDADVEGGNVLAPNPKKR
jgi:hypothetical protein